jgi:hypothetical protein
VFEAADVVEVVATPVTSPIAGTGLAPDVSALKNSVPLPLGPGAICSLPGAASWKPAGSGKFAIAPVPTSSWPISSAPDSANQMLPSGPLVIALICGLAASPLE